METRMLPLKRHAYCNDVDELKEAESVLPAGSKKRKADQLVTVKKGKQ